jgi:uncharacterized membrane protein (UPF0127 family)
MRAWLSIVLLLVTQSAAGEVRFEHARIALGDRVLEVEIADNEVAWQQGLQGRSSLEAGEGMLFVFPDSGPRVFWMRHTFVPLSLGSFDSQRKLIAITKLNPARSLLQVRFPKVTTPEQTLYVLEVPQGWFEDNQVPLGASFEFVTE